jgi:hypothetical protein
MRGKKPTRELVVQELAGDTFSGWWLGCHPCFQFDGFNEMEILQPNFSSPSPSGTFTKHREKVYLAGVKLCVEFCVANM